MTKLVVLFRAKTFSQWLKMQTGRDDPVGDLASDFLRDAHPPSKPNNLTSWRGRLKAQPTCRGARDALEEAWKEWRVYKRETLSALAKRR